MFLGPVFGPFFATFLHFLKKVDLGWCCPFLVISDFLSFRLHVRVRRCGANSVRGVTVLRGKYFVEFVVVTGGVTVIFQNPDFVVVTSWWI